MSKLEASKMVHFGNYVHPMNYWCTHLNISNTIVHNIWWPIYLNEDKTSLYTNMIFTKFIHCKDTTCLQCSCMLMIVEHT